MPSQISTAGAIRAVDWARAYGVDQLPLRNLAAQVDQLLATAVDVKRGVSGATARLAAQLENLSDATRLPIDLDRATDLVDRISAGQKLELIFPSDAVVLLLGATAHASTDPDHGITLIGAMPELLARMLTLEAWGARRVRGGDDQGPGGGPLLAGFEGPLPGPLLYPGPEGGENREPAWWRNDLPFEDRAAALLRAISRIVRLWVVELPCELQAWRRASIESGLAPSFRIESVDPLDACPGDTTTIRGQGFGLVGGRVTYTRHGGLMDGKAIPLSWSDSAVTFQVPHDCTEGKLGLQVVDHTFVDCGQTWEVFRLGTTDQFHLTGARPDASAITLDGQAAGTAVTMGTKATVSWQASTDPRVSIEVKVTCHGPETPVTSLADEIRGAGPGTLVTAAIPMANRRQTIGVSVTASSPCGAWVETAIFYSQPRIAIDVTGIEITQGTQVFPKLVAPKRNSLPVVAEKQTCLRVYARARLNPPSFDFGSGPGRIPGVTGHISWKSAGGNYWGGQSVASVSYDDDPTPDRDFINAALIFRIPAHAVVGTCSGTITMSVGPFAPASSTLTFTTTSPLTNFVPRRSLRILLVRVGWGGGDLGGDLSGLKNLIDVLPVPDNRVEFVPKVQLLLTNADLNTKDGWEDALDDLADAAEDWDEARDLVLGSLETVAGLANGGISDPSERVCLAQDRLPATIAHEVVHLFGVGHANCAEPGQSIKEIDSRLPSNGHFYENVFRPQSLVLYDQPMTDLMSYCKPSATKHTFTTNVACNYQDRQVSPELWRLLFKVLPQGG